MRFRSQSVYVVTFEIHCSFRASRGSRPLLRGGEGPVPSLPDGLAEVETARPSLTVLGSWPSLKRCLEGEDFPLLAVIFSVFSTLLLLALRVRQRRRRGIILC